MCARQLRGCDEALSVVGDREELRKALAQHDLRSREEILTSILSCYDGNAYGATMWPRKHGAWGDLPERTTVQGTFFERYPQLQSLNLDWGFVSYLPAFLAYAKSHHTGDDPLQVRQQFKKYLGSARVWRGIRLTQTDRDAVTITGIRSAFFRTVTQETALEDLETNVLCAYPWAVLDRQCNGGHRLSPLISVSADRSLAIRVGGSASHTSASGEEKKLYLFELAIPLLDILPYTDHCLPLPNFLDYRVKEEQEMMRRKNQRTVHPVWKTNVEQFVMYKINPEEIISIS